MAERRLTAGGSRAPRLRAPAVSGTRTAPDAAPARSTRAARSATLQGKGERQRGVESRASACSTWKTTATCARPWRPCSPARATTSTWPSAPTRGSRGSEPDAFTWSSATTRCPTTPAHGCCARPPRAGCWSAPGRSSSPPRLTPATPAARRPAQAAGGRAAPGARGPAGGVHPLNGGWRRALATTERCSGALAIRGRSGQRAAPPPMTRYLALLALLAACSTKAATSPADGAPVSTARPKPAASAPPPAALRRPPLLGRAPPRRRRRPRPSAAAPLPRRPPRRPPPPPQEAPLPAVKVSNIGMHIGGGPNDDVTKDPIRRSVQPHFDAFRRCFAQVEDAGKARRFRRRPARRSRRRQGAGEPPAHDAQGQGVQGLRGAHLRGDRLPQAQGRHHQRQLLAPLHARIVFLHSAESAVRPFLHSARERSATLPAQRPRALRDPSCTAPESAPRLPAQRPRALRDPRP